MKKSSPTVLLVAGVPAILAATGAMGVWSLNQVFGLGLKFSILNILAVVFLVACVSGSRGSR